MNAVVIVEPLSVRAAAANPRSCPLENRIQAITNQRACRTGRPHGRGRFHITVPPRGVTAAITTATAPPKQIAASGMADGRLARLCTTAICARSTSPHVPVRDRRVDSHVGVTSEEPARCCSGKTTRSATTCAVCERRGYRRAWRNG